MSRSWYRDGDLYVVVETGMPEHQTEVGVGETPAEAVEGLQQTALQSTGPDMGRQATIEWAAAAGWISSEDLDDADDDECDAAVEAESAPDKPDDADDCLAEDAAEREADQRRMNGDE